MTDQHIEDAHIVRAAAIDEHPTAYAAAAPPAPTHPAPAPAAASAAEAAATAFAHTGQAAAPADPDDAVYVEATLRCWVPKHPRAVDCVMQEPGDRFWIERARVSPVSMAAVLPQDPPARGEVERHAAALDALNQATAAAAARREELRTRKARRTQEAVTAEAILRAIGPSLGSTLNNQTADPELLSKLQAQLEAQAKELAALKAERAAQAKAGANGGAADGAGGSGASARSARKR